MNSWQVCDVITGYVFWSIFHGFGPLIWFYPLNELEISGYEVFVLVYLIPILAKIPVVNRCLKSRIGQLSLKLGMLVGLASFRASTTFTRLCTLTGGTGCAMLQLTCDLEAANFWSYVFGYIALLMSRVFCRSLMPAWASQSGNLLVITIFCAATVYAIFGPKRAQPRGKLEGFSRNWIAAGLGFGSLVFVTQLLFGELSVPSRWVVAPFPAYNAGPNPWGIAIFAGLLLGIYMAQYGIAATFGEWWLWSILSTASFYGVYYFAGIGGFAFALVFSIFMGFSFPILLKLTAQCSSVPGALFVAMLVYLVQIFYAVWTTAYNFVPGGTLTREFTGLVIFTSMSCLALAMYKSSLAKLASPLPRGSLRFLVGCFLVASLAMGYRFVQWRLGHGGVRKMESAIHTNTTDISALIWTYHFAYDNKGWPSLERTLQLFEALQPDIVVLLESDASKPYMGNNDIAQWLAERGNFFVDFGPPTKTHTWGNLILSKFPIIRSEHFLLPSPHGELAPALLAVLDVGGQKLGVLGTHMGNDRDDLDRRLQAETLANISVRVQLERTPLIFLGYVTSKPGSRDYLTLTQKGQLRDIDPTDRHRFCEYILYNGLSRLGYARISHGGLTDTEIQVGKFRFGDLQERNQEERDPGKVGPGIQFPAVFGEFYSGHYYKEEHHYHMNTPKYFLP